MDKMKIENEDLGFSKEARKQKIIVFAIIGIFVLAIAGYFYLFEIYNDSVLKEFTGNVVRGITGYSICTPENNIQFCTRLGKNCGEVKAKDNCGTTRTVSVCGTCSGQASCGGGGIANVCDYFAGTSDVTQSELIERFAIIQLLTPEPNPASVFYEEKKAKGVTLATLPKESKELVLNRIFGNINAQPGSTASVIIKGVNYTALLLQGEYNGQPALEIVVYGAINKISTFPSFLRVPFLKRGIVLPNMDDNRCLNGILESGESCEVNFNSILNDNQNVFQKNETCFGNKVARRDNFGGCSLNCKPVQDNFDSGVCEKGVCDAQCSNDADCSSLGSGAKCDNSCSCVASGQSYCGDSNIDSFNGEQCEKDNDCSVRNEKCVSCKCVPKTFCGNGIVERKNDDGINEQCDYQSFNRFTSCGISNVGQCRLGVSACTDSCTYSAQCTGQILPDLTETCDDGIDNNCNGEIDEGCTCTDGEKQACGSDVGICKKGEQSCNNGEWGSCSGEITPENEICDGIDNNCNGIVDEGVRNIFNECGVAVLREICDGEDNNNNGEIDEGDICDEAEVKFCTDSDKSNDIHLRGSVRYYNEIFDDICEESGDSVKQYFCFGNTLETFVTRCEEGYCSFGACVQTQGNSESQEATPNCIDTDSSNNLQLKGEVVYNDDSYNDKCEESGKSVRQYFCSNDKISNFVSRCEEGTLCNDGKCS